MFGRKSAWMIAIVVATPGGILATLSCSLKMGPEALGPSSPPTVKIVRPKQGQTFKPTDIITLEGTAVDTIDGDIEKELEPALNPDYVRTRMIWTGGFQGRALDPVGQGHLPTDDIGPLDAGGTFTIRLEVTNSSAQTGSDQISINIQ